MFLTYLAVERKLAAATIAQARAALQFLYRHVIDRPLVGLGDTPRARVPARLPVVLTESEVARVLDTLDGVPHLVAMLLYGSGLRLMECLTLRVKDVDLERREIRVRRGKGVRDRITMLPEAVRGALEAHLTLVRATHTRDLASGGGAVALPDALRRKYPHSAREWPWQWVFPARRRYVDRDTGSSAAITCTKASCSAPWPPRCARAVSGSARAVTPSVTPSPLTSWRQATISAPFRSSSATATSRRR